MRLYGYWRSTSSWRVRLGLALKGLEYEYAAVPLLEGAQHEGPLRARNPLRQVPVLELDDGRVLAQSMAILDYLEALRPEPPLLPGDAFARARARQLAEVVNAGIQPLQNLAVIRQLEGLGVDPRAWSASWIARGLRALEAEARGADGPFLTGDAPALPEVFLIPQLYNARRFEVALEPFPTLLGIEARCAELEPFRRAHPDRQPDAPSGAPA